MGNMESNKGMGLSAYEAALFSNAIPVSEFADFTVDDRAKAAICGKLDAWWDTFWYEFNLIYQGVTTI